MPSKNNNIFTFFLILVKTIKTIYLDKYRERNDVNMWALIFYIDLDLPLHKRWNNVGELLI